MKLLCIDSEPIYQEIISHCAQNSDLEVKTASSFDEAVATYLEWKPDIVTLDAIVNGGSGIELAKKLKAFFPDRFVPFMFLSSQISDSVMNQCFRAGADDFLPKPFNEFLFNTRLSTHKRQVHLIQEMYKKNRELTFYQTMIEREHKMAHQVLDHILLRSEGENQNVVITRLSADSFNGDLALVATRKDKSKLVFVGDFTGHGLSASIGALPVAQVFFDAVDEQTKLSELTTRINKVLLSILPDYMFCAAYIMKIEPDGRVSYWGGGMPNAYIYRSDKSIDFLRSSHMPLGILEGEDFDATVDVEQLRDADTLIIASDGVLELKNCDDKMLGPNAMEEMIVSSFEHADLISAHKALENQLHAFQGSSKQLDDITLVSIRKDRF